MTEKLKRKPAWGNSSSRRLSQLRQLDGLVEPPLAPRSLLYSQVFHYINVSDYSGGVLFGIASLYRLKVFTFF